LLPRQAGSCDESMLRPLRAICARLRRARRKIRVPMACRLQSVSDGAGGRGSGSSSFFRLLRRCPGHRRPLLRPPAVWRMRAGVWAVLVVATLVCPGWQVQAGEGQHSWLANAGLRVRRPSGACMQACGRCWWWRRCHRWPASASRSRNCRLRAGVLAVVAVAPSERPSVQMPPHLSSKKSKVVKKKHFMLC